MQSPVSASTNGLVTHTDRLLVIVGGSDFDPALLRGLAQEGAFVVGADGGADAALEAGVVPDLVVGDLDSISDADAWRDRTRVIEIAEQDTTDFEKCLYSVIAPMTLALGMTGRRFDHTLAALHAVTRYGAERRIVLVDELDAALALNGPVAFDLPAGARVSIHPLETVRFAQSSGLRFALTGLTLAPGVRTGTSNEALGGPIRIEPDPSRSGVYLLILPLDALQKLLSMAET